MKVTALATRSGDWWAVEVPEVDGAFTQAKRLDQVPAMVADAVSLLADVDPDSVEVQVEVQTDEATADVLARARALGEQSKAAEDAYAVMSREIVVLLRSQGLSVRDVAQMVALSPARVSQLESSAAVRNAIVHAPTARAEFKAHRPRVVGVVKGGKSDMPSSGQYAAKRGRGLAPTQDERVAAARRGELGSPSDYGKGA